MERNGIGITPRERAIWEVAVDVLVSYVIAGFAIFNLDITPFNRIMFLHPGVVFLFCLIEFLFRRSRKCQGAASEQSLALIIASFEPLANEAVDSRLGRSRDLPRGTPHLHDCALHLPDCVPADRSRCQLYLHSISHPLLALQCHGLCSASKWPASFWWPPMRLP